MAEDLWIGGDVGSLNDPANWSQGSVPGPTTTAVFGAGAGLVEPLSGSARFAASVVSVAAGVRLVVDGNGSQSEFAIGRLDIAPGATVDFNRSHVIAQQINIGISVSGAGGGTAMLDLEYASLLGDSVNGPASIMGPPSVGLGYAWSEAHGYGNVALSAIVGSLNIGRNASVNLGSATIAAYSFAANPVASVPASQVVPPRPVRAVLSICFRHERRRKCGHAVLDRRPINRFPEWTIWTGQPRQLV